MEYQSRGNNLLDGYERERQKALELDQAGLNQTKTILSVVYNEALANARNITKVSEERRTRRVQNIENKWKEEQDASSRAILQALHEVFD